MRRPSAGASTHPAVQHTPPIAYCLERFALVCLAYYVTRHRSPLERVMHINPSGQRAVFLPSPLVGESLP